MCIIGAEFKPFLQLKRRDGEGLGEGMEGESIRVCMLDV